MKQKKDKNRNKRIPISWRVWQALGCCIAGSLLFSAIYRKFYAELQATVNSAPDPVERIMFSTGFAFFFTILMAVWSNVILQRIYRKQPMADIAEDIAKEVAAEVLDSIVDGVIGGATGGSNGSSGTKGGGGSSGGGGASGSY
jgi:uncharacterized membrane protein YgcG